MKAFSFATILVLGGGACAALAAAIMAAAVTADESTSVGMGAFCLLFPGGPGACANLPTDTGFHSELYMLQTDVLTMANRTGGVATAVAPGSPHGDLYMCCAPARLRRREEWHSDFFGGVAAFPAECFPSFSIASRCDSALRTSGGGGVGAAPSPALVP